MKTADRHEALGIRRIWIPACAGMTFFLLLTFTFAFSQEWEKILAAAKKEGQVNVYIGGWGVVLDEGVFQKRFPEIKLVGVSLRGGGDIAKRVLAERRAEKYLADVVIEGFNSNYNTLHAAKVFDPIKPALVLPEVSTSPSGGAANTAIWIPKVNTFSDSPECRKPAPPTITASR